MKVKAKKDFIARKNNPEFSYRFIGGKTMEIPDEHWDYLKNISYLEQVKGKKKRGDK